MYETFFNTYQTFHARIPLIISTTMLVLIRSISNINIKSLQLDGKTCLRLNESKILIRICIPYIYGMSK